MNVSSHRVHSGFLTLLLSIMALVGGVMAQQCPTPTQMSYGNKESIGLMSNGVGVWVRGHTFRATASGYLCKIILPLTPQTQSFTQDVSIYAATVTDAQVVDQLVTPLATYALTYSGSGGDLELDLCGQMLVQSGTDYKMAFVTKLGGTFRYRTTSDPNAGNFFAGYQGQGSGSLATTVGSADFDDGGFDDGGVDAGGVDSFVCFHYDVFCSDVFCFERGLAASRNHLNPLLELFLVDVGINNVVNVSSGDHLLDVNVFSGDHLLKFLASRKVPHASVTTLVSSENPPASTTSGITETPPTSTSSRINETPSASTSLSTAPLATTTTLVYDGTCDGVKDGDIVCRSLNTFNFCVGGTFVWDAAQRCAEGTVCCKDTNKCDFAFNCPSVPQDTADRCYGKSDNSIVCTASDRFKICASGQSKLSAELQCQPGLVCCETLNRCDTLCPVLPPPGQPVPTSTQPAPPAPTVPAPGPGPSNCAGQGDGNVVCKTLKTFNFCINGQFLTTPDLSCPEGTVCCASSQSCDFQFNCKSVRPTVVNPPLATIPAPAPGGPVPTILPATCQGRANGNIICTSTSTFNICIDNGPELPSGDRLLPGQEHLRLCQQLPAGCGGASSLTLSLAFAIALTVPVAVAIPVSRKPDPCKLHESDPILDSASQSCPFNTICCASKRSCVLPGDCSDPVPTLPGDVAPPQPTLIFNRFCGNSYTGLKCTGKNTFIFCESGVLNSAKDQTCAGGLVCCPTLGACTFEAQCPIAVGAAAQDFVPPVPAYTGQGVAGKVCTGVLDGAVVCLTDKEFNYCLSDAFLYEKPMACPSDTVCCTHTNRCEWSWNCKPKEATPPPPVVSVTDAEAYAFGSCIGFATGGTTCVSETDFVYCNENGPLLPLIRKTCVAGSVCCATTGVCQLPNSCSAAALDPPNVPADGRIDPVAVDDPVPSLAAEEGHDGAVGAAEGSPMEMAPGATRCQKGDMNTLFCRGEMEYEVCTGED
ncbi:hypothetical protein HDU96_010805 [Phlyctochytrium bullatum]|nr:hypothetical protein HDU96_010805 [Phlyctochytrium bullatum]